ncbi:ribonuclease E inhibitor RraB [Rhizobium wenxiniae]|uniref:ribonuclease E inhibitor RraB n=1 Tax=Rhizobium wenxiniae TaxID=1737357 RepID=UPI003C29851D
MSLLDENTAILMKFVAEGKDLSYIRVVDFSHLFPDPASANRFAAEAEAEGFKIAIDRSHSPEDPWDVTASKVMFPSAVAITEAETRLSALAELHQGYADGWGVLSVR